MQSMLAQTGASPHGWPWLEHAVWPRSADDQMNVRALATSTTAPLMQMFGMSPIS